MVLGRIIGAIVLSNENLYSIHLLGYCADEEEVPGPEKRLGGLDQANEMLGRILLGRYSTSALFQTGSHLPLRLYDVPGVILAGSKPPNRFSSPGTSSSSAAEEFPSTFTRSLESSTK